MTAADTRTMRHLNPFGDRVLSAPTSRLILASLALFAYQTGLAADGLCGSVRKFVELVKPDETRVVAFHTEYGSGFRGDDDNKVYAKRCDYDAYEPAKSLCDLLMDEGAAELSDPGNNAKSVIACLSPKVRFDDQTRIDGIELALTHGTDDHGSQVEIKLTPDDRLGGTVLIVSARGLSPPESHSTPAYAKALRGIDKAKCHANGGSIRDVCILQLPTCVTPYPDAGRKCSDKSQCKGKCLIDIDHRPAPGEHVTGRCEKDDDPCGYKPEVVKGLFAGGDCRD